jgi:hypothetical protein
MESLLSSVLFRDLCCVDVGLPDGPTASTEAFESNVDKVVASGKKKE